MLAPGPEPGVGFIDESGLPLAGDVAVVAQEPSAGADEQGCGLGYEQQARGEAVTGRAEALRDHELWPVAGSDSDEAVADR